MARALVIGFGNTLRSDDGLGHYVAKQLSMEVSDPDVQILDMHELVAEIADSVCRAEMVIFVDAAGDGEPGHLRCARLAPAAEGGASSHHLSPASLLQLTVKLYGRCPPAYLITVTGANFDLGETLSPTVAAAIPGVVKQIRELLTGNEDSGC